MFGQGRPSLVRGLSRLATHCLPARLRVSRRGSARSWLVLVLFGAIAWRSLSAQEPSTIPLPIFNSVPITPPVTPPAPVAAATTSTASNNIAGDATDWSVQLRIAWGGGPERLWQGEIAWSAGGVTLVRALGIEADEPGSMSVVGGMLQIRTPSTRSYDGLDLRVPYEPGGKLRIRLRSNDGATLDEEITIEELLHKSWQRALDERGNRLFIRRLPSDQLRFQPERDALVFAPKEPWTFEVTPHLLPITEGNGAKIKARLLNKTTNTELLAQEFVIEPWKQDWSKPAEGAARQPSIPFVIALPEAEGVYELALEAIERGPLRWGKTIATRTVQLIVVADKNPKPVEAANWQKILELDPTSNSWSERFRNSWSMWPGARPAPLDNGQAAVHLLGGNLGNAMKLAAPTPGNDPAWQAFPLAIGKIGQPHVLEVEYPGNLPQRLGISLVEPNAAGQVQPIGLDSGVVVVSEGSLGSPTWVKHRLYFWPRTKMPLVLLTNRSAAQPAFYGKIRVLSGPAQLPPLEAVGKLPNERTFAALWNRPLFPEQFGAAEAIDTWSGRPLDDWQTMYEGASRLVEYLRHTGYNSATVSVWSDGSSLYPSNLLQPTPRYDTGMFFDAGNDPRRKDVAELLARLCDRDGIQLMMQLQFASPLPALEEQLRGGNDDPTGIVLIGAEGKPYASVYPPRRGLAPLYNPLDERVQRAMLDVVTEVAARYGKHPSFGGISLELSGETYLAMPGETWGLDDRTFARFLQSRGSTQRFEGPERHWQRARYLQDNATVRQQWIDWRAAELRRFYEKLQLAVRAVRNDARLVIAPTQPLEAADLLDASLPRVAGGNRLSARAMLGIEGTTLVGNEQQATANLDWLRPWPQSASEQWSNQAASLGLASDPDWDRWAKSSVLQGSLFYHEPQRLRLPSFDAKSPFGKDKTFTWQVAQFTPSGLGNRGRFARALARADQATLVDGGVMPLMGQEESLNDWMTTFRRLPAARFETLPSDTEPVTLRRLVRDGQTWFYAVNASPWTVKLELDLQQPGVRPMELSGLRLVPAPVGSSWKIDLQPYDLLAFRMPGEVSFRQAKVEFPSELRPELEQRIAQLRERRLRLENPPALARLANADLEQTTANGQPLGWQVNTAVPDTASWTSEESLPHGGKRSGKFRAVTVQGATLRSDRFDPPQSGRLALSLWVRSAPAANNTSPAANNTVPANGPALRVALEGNWREREYLRFAEVGAATGAPLKNTWAQYILQVDDLPLEGLGNLCVRIDLLGTGEVYLDDVQLFDLNFTEQERRQFDKQLALADFQLQQGQLGLCYQDLQGYWPRYLLELVPATPPSPQATAQQNTVQQLAPPAAVPNETPAARPPEKQATKPGAMERVKEWWRF